MGYLSQKAAAAPRTASPSMTHARFTTNQLRSRRRWLRFHWFLAPPFSVIRERFERDPLGRIECDFEDRRFPD